MDFPESDSFTPYTGFGRFGFQIQYCFAGQCSKFIPFSQKVAIVPLYPDVFWADSFDGKNVQLVILGDKRTPYYKFEETFYPEGGTTGYQQSALNLTVPDTLTIDKTDHSTSPGKIRINRQLMPTKDGKYKYSISPCSESCLDYKLQYNGEFAVIDLDENLPYGSVYSFVAGENRLQGWAIDNDASVAEVRLKVDDQVISNSTQNANLSSGRDGNNGFSYNDLQSLLEADYVNLYQPFQIVVEVKDSPSTNYVTIATLNISNFFNNAPIAVNDAKRGEPGKPLVINVVNNDIDFEGQQLTPFEITQPAYGVVTLQPDNTILYEPDANSVATEDRFTYKVIDENQAASLQSAVVDLYFNDNGLFAAQDLAFIEVGSAPTVSKTKQLSSARNKLRLSSQDTSGAVNVIDSIVNINVLKNDTGATFGNIDVKLGDIPPQNGGLTFNDDKTISYQPNGQFEYSDCFNYYFTNNAMASNTANVCIIASPTPVPDGVGVGVSPDNDPASDDAVDIFVLDNDLIRTNPQQYIPFIRTKPSKGKVSINGSATSLQGKPLDDASSSIVANNNATNASQSFIRYTPNPGASGVDSFYYSIQHIGQISSSFSGKTMPGESKALVTIVIGDAPAIPANLRVSKPTTSSLSVQWNGVSWSGTNARTYHLQKLKRDEAVDLSKVSQLEWRTVAYLDSSITSHALTGLDDGKYYFRVRACKDIYLCSPWSNIGDKTIGKVFTTTYVMTDVLGSPIAEFDASGSVKRRNHYQPFGKMKETEQDDIGYAGHEFDTDLGLSYMQARYYDPEIGRFYANDPVGYTLNNPVMSFNRYLYVNNNPYKYTDPDGEFIFLAFAVVSAGFTAYDTYQTYKNEGVEAAAKSLAIDGAISLAGGGALKLTGKLFKGFRNLIKGSKCFVAGTLVHTNNGLKAIDDIQIGDVVLSKDDNTGEVGYKKVSQLFHNKDKTILNLLFVNNDGIQEFINVTPEHPFRLVNGSWIEAGELASGDQVVGIDDKTLSLKSVATDAKRYDTYNFEVNDFHTYFVGKSGIWVHNACTNSGPHSAEEKALQSMLKEDTADGAKLSTGDAKAYMELSEELGNKATNHTGVKGIKDGTTSNHYQGGDHIHLERMRDASKDKHIEVDGVIE